MRIYRTTDSGNDSLYFGEGARELLIEEVEKLAPDRLFLITDRTVEALFSEDLQENLPSSVPVETVVFNEGEENKNLATLQHVAGDLVRAGVSDRSAILNFGGGVVLNVGGLAASLLGHGIRFIQVATTLNAMCQVIASDRQAINFVGDRNRFGLFRRPLFSIADTFYLTEEPERQMRSALVDFVKRGLVMGGESYSRVETALARTDFLRGAALNETAQAWLEQSLAFRRGDPGEWNADALDAYGLTLGRALEIQAEGRLTIGEARFFGMKISAHVARNAGIMSGEDFERHEALLDRLSIATPFPSAVRTDRLIYQLHGNNKTMTGQTPMMLLEGIGRVAGGAGNGAATARISVSDRDVAAAVEEIRRERALT